MLYHIISGNSHHRTKVHERWLPKPGQLEAPLRPETQPQELSSTGSSGSLAQLVVVKSDDHTLCSPAVAVTCVCVCARQSSTVAMAVAVVLWCGAARAGEELQPPRQATGRQRQELGKGVEDLAPNV